MVTHRENFSCASIEFSISSVTSAWKLQTPARMLCKKERNEKIKKDCISFIIFFHLHWCALVPLTNQSFCSLIVLEKCALDVDRANKNRSASFS